MIRSRWITAAEDHTLARHRERTGLCITAKMVPAYRETRPTRIAANACDQRHSATRIVAFITSALHSFSSD